MMYDDESWRIRGHSIDVAPFKKGRLRKEFAGVETALRSVREGRV